MNIDDKTKGRRYLVTGASGFIGRAVCHRLLQLGAEVHGTSRRSVEFSADNWMHSACDLTNADEVDRLFAKCRPEFVINLASCVTGKREIEWVRETLTGNLQSAINVLVAAAQCGVAKTVIAGSLEEPEAGQSLPVPASPYAASKWCASGYARMMHALYSMRVAVARIFMVYGPGQEDLLKLVPYVCLSAAKGVPPKLMSGARPVDWVFVDDCADGLIRMTMSGPDDGSYVDLGSGRFVSTGEVAEMICEVAGTGVRPECGAVPDRPMEQVRKADAAATRSALDWAAGTELRAGLEQTYRWYQQIANNPESAKAGEA